MFDAVFISRHQLDGPGLTANSFLPPPPPRYTTPVAYAAGTSNGLPVPVLETSNVLKHPEGGCPLRVGEGTYVLKDDLQLATPPPHPSEAPIINPNPLATNPTPPTVGVKLSLVILNPDRQPPRLLRSETWSSTVSDLRRIKEHDREGRVSNDSRDAHGEESTAPAFGEGSLAVVSNLGGKDKDASGLKRRKPKSGIVKSSSSFISRVIAHESATKKLAERSPDGLFVFANINRAFQWLDCASKTKQDPLTKILFTKAHMLSHDVNDLTKSATHLDIVMGSSLGDILWYEPMQQKYARINKNGAINNSPVTHIKWIPGSENFFLAAHSNGCLVVYDKEKEDAPFTPEEPEVATNLPAIDEKQEYEGARPLFTVLKSVNSKNQRTHNPVACWNFSNQRINDFAFSPDRRHLALVLEDGSLRIIDYLEEKLLDVYTSYYGGLICVCWSPDGKYILTGGQDDLVSIWSFSERKIVARCQGHNSWVTCVAFDPWRCDERTYRFGSVGDDCRLLLWDFSVAMLHRPKALQVTARQRSSIVATGMHQVNRTRAESLTAAIRSDSIRTDKPADEKEIVHSVESRARTAQLPPILSKVVGDDPLSWLGFLEDSIMTSSLEGHIRTWDRPSETGNEPDISGTGSSVANASGPRSTAGTDASC